MTRLAAIKARLAAATQGHDPVIPWTCDCKLCDRMAEAFKEPSDG